MHGFDAAAFLDDTPRPTKFRAQNLRCAYRAIDSIRRVNFQSGMRSYMAEQNLRSASATSSHSSSILPSSTTTRTSMSCTHEPCSGGGECTSADVSCIQSCTITTTTTTTTTTATTTTTSLSPYNSHRSSSSTTQLTGRVGSTTRSVPVSRAVSSCDLLQQMRMRTQSDESLLKQRQVLQREFEEVAAELNRALGGDAGGARKELEALKLEIEDVKSKMGCETKFLNLLVKALQGAVRTISRSAVHAEADEERELIVNRT